MTTGNEPINVGDRVRFRGDHSTRPLWMTVTQRDVNPLDNQGRTIGGVFLKLMWPVAGGRSMDGAGVPDDVRQVPSVMEGAVTTKPYQADREAGPLKPEPTRSTPKKRSTRR